MKQKLLVTQDLNVNSAKDISDVIKNKLKDLKIPRYKWIVQTYYGEQKNQGINLVNKCFWDQKNDFCFTEQFNNDVLFCFVVVYAIYVY